MAKDQSGYFGGKHPWSQTKDDLLRCYLTPYFQKIYKYSPDGIVYVDAFAGQGKFDDGTFGSPIIALNKLQAIARKEKNKHPVQFIFSETDAKRRLKLQKVFIEERGSSRYIKDPIIHADFCDAMRTAQHITPRGNKKPSTLFYYIDPFGVKDLKMDFLLHSPNPQHTEALVNFNSIGFVRDACAALRVRCSFPNDVEIFDDGFTEEDHHEKRIERLTSCVGSDEWISVIRRFQVGQIDCWQAEYEVAKLFCNNASAAFRYVTNMPIKDTKKRPISGGLLKYRMIHMTNNADGCVLMNDNMIKRNESRQMNQYGLFKVDVDGQDIEPKIIELKLREALSRLPAHKSIKMGKIAADIISSCGVFDKSNPLLKTYVGPLLQDGTLERVEKYTKTGKPKTSFNPNDLIYKA